MACCFPQQELAMWPGCQSKPNYSGLTAGAHTWDPSWDLGPKMTEDTDGSLLLGRVVDLLLKSPRSPQKIGFDRLCHKPMHLDAYPGLESPNAAYCHDEDISPQRYSAACPLVPGIVAEGAPNPCGAPYRMLDGRHRICKLKLEFPEVKAAWFFVVRWDEIMELISSKSEASDHESMARKQAVRLGKSLDRIADGYRTNALREPYSEDLLAQAKVFMAASRMRTLQHETLSAEDQMAQMMAESKEKGLPEEVRLAYQGINPESIDRNKAGAPHSDL